jgi:hypothetical protein
MECRNHFPISFNFRIIFTVFNKSINENINFQLLQSGLCFNFYVNSIDLLLIQKKLVLHCYYNFLILIFF